MRFRASTIRGLAPLLLLPLVGCKTWEPAASQRAVADAPPPSVRVTTADGTIMTLKNPVFINDSIVAAVAPSPGTVVLPPRSGVPEGDINLIEVPQFDTGRTILLAGVIIGASIGWARFQGSGGGSEPRPGPLPKDPALDLMPLLRVLLGSN